MFEMSGRLSHSMRPCRTADVGRLNAAHFHETSFRNLGKSGNREWLLGDLSPLLNYCNIV
jgi:hypothetical protein